MKFDIKQLPDTLFIDGIKLELNTRMGKGRNNLKDIIWYSYKIINNKEKDIPYDDISLSFFKITEKVRLDATKNIVKNVSSPSTIRPHIDCNSGNIHPSKEFVKQQNNEKIAQLVLCNGLGPKTPFEVNESMYAYKPIGSKKMFYVHKACYYPLIDEETNDPKIINNWRHKLLKQVWNELIKIKTST